MFVIGLTGGIGTGKTEVMKILRELGADVISADDAGHRSYRAGSEGWRRVVGEFGENVVAPSGEVDRSRLGVIVFEDEEALKRLNAIVHPLIRSYVQGKLGELEGRGASVAVVEAALLLEAGWADLVDEIWVTVAPKDRVVERIVARDDLIEEEVNARIKAQMPQARRAAQADAVIDNDSTGDQLRRRVLALWRLRVSGRGRQAIHQ